MDFNTYMVQGSTHETFGRYEEAAIAYAQAAQALTAEESSPDVAMNTAWAMLMRATALGKMRQPNWELMQSVLEDALAVLGRLNRHEYPRAGRLRYDILMTAQRRRMVLKRG